MTWLLVGAILLIALGGAVIGGLHVYWKGYNEGYRDGIQTVRKDWKLPDES